MSRHLIVLPYIVYKLLFIISSC